MDIEGLLKSLNAHSVRYVVIGATAFPVHGYARATLDLDLFIEPTAANASRAREALVAFGYDMSDAVSTRLSSSGVTLRAGSGGSGGGPRSRPARSRRFPRDAGRAD